MATDPLTLFTQTFEQYLIDSPAIKRVMRSNLAGRIDAFVTTRGTKQPDTFSESDLPRIIILPQGGPCGAIASNLVQFEMSYEVGIKSADKRFSFDLYPLTFAVFAACSQALHDATFDDLSWEGYAFCNKLEISNMAHAFTSTTGDAQGISGTQTVCTITATLHFPESLLETWNA